MVDEASERESCELSEGRQSEVLRDSETRVCSATRARREVRVGVVDSRGVYECTKVSSASVKLRRDCREACGQEPTRDSRSASVQIRRYTSPRYMGHTRIDSGV